jgi:hypothetical protein
VAADIRLVQPEFPRNFPHRSFATGTQQVTHKVAGGLHPASILSRTAPYTTQKATLNAELQQNVAAG